MGSSIRALSSTLHRFNSTSAILTRTTLSSSYSISSLPSSLWTTRISVPGERRTIRTVSPLSMGRRSSKIAGRCARREKNEAMFQDWEGTRRSFEEGWPNPVTNTTLASVLEKAKELDVPKEIIDRNIKRAAEKGQEAYIEKVYEAYGYGGASMVIEVMTDKITRSVQFVREVVKNSGGKMADPGSVLFKFRRARVVNIKASDADKDQLLSIALDAGAEDVIDPPACEDDTEEDQERYFKIVSDYENYPAILSKLREEGIKFETDNGSELLPISPIEVDDEAMELNKELMANLLELDDVDAVYTDQKCDRIHGLLNQNEEEGRSETKKNER